VVFIVTLLSKQAPGAVGPGSGMSQLDRGSAVQEICLVNIRVDTVVKIIILKSLFGFVGIAGHINVPVGLIEPIIEIEAHAVEFKVFVDSLHRYLLAWARAKCPFALHYYSDLIFWLVKGWWKIILLLV